MAVTQTRDSKIAQINHDESTQMRNIMVATDGSEGANRAVDTAAELARAVGGTLSIISVGSMLTSEEEKQFARIEGDAANPSELLARRNLSEAEQRARQAGIASAKVKLAWGDPTQAIIEAIQQEKADAIVVGRRGRGRLYGLLLGSVSQKLVCLAPCIVIVAP
jgi:nucleotide-binding universal stress UspA family protein